jgi:formylglycine-generating enzyme required for sulfatase activity
MDADFCPVDIQYRETYNAAMRKKTAESAGAISNADDRVQLKPIMGIRPGVYLAAIYAVILALILFFILVYPGIARPGSMVMLKTGPAGAALRVDGIYLGTSPGNIFVSKGPHTLELVLPGFTTETVQCDIPGRLFASALFPKTYPLELTLNSPNPMAALALAARDYAEWSFGGEPTASWQIPLSLSEGVYRIGAAGSPQVDEILTAAARFASTRAALRDIVRAKMLSGSKGLSPSPLGAVRSTAEIISFLSENSCGAAWLADLLPPESAAIVTASTWYQKQLASFAGITAGESLAPSPEEALSYPAEAAPPLRQLRVGGLLFTGIAGGTLVQGEPFPHRIPINPFMICTIEVPAPAFADFLDANPQWRADQREVLISQGLVTGDYLAEAGNNTAGMTPGALNAGLNSVSWFTAQAFCAWLSSRLPPSLADYEIRLPTEAEWEYAAKSIKAWDGAAQGISAIDGGAWEWCSGPYAPLAFIKAGQPAIDLIGSPELPVRGGSWLNAAGSTGLETRASLPPALCSTFVSFRPVIARKGL